MNLAVSFSTCRYLKVCVNFSKFEPLIKKRPKSLGNVGW